jgi:hypothetical protein
MFRNLLFVSGPTVVGASGKVPGLGNAALRILSDFPCEMQVNFIHRVAANFVD